MKSTSPWIPPLDLDSVDSSYREHGYGQLLYSLTRIHKPRVVVELGTFEGYSALHIAAALADDTSSTSEFYMIDLWDDYPYRHCSLQTAQDNFAKNGLLSRDHLTCHFLHQNAMDYFAASPDGSIDLLHVDLNNDGDSLKFCLKHWDDKLRSDAILILEGGSKERDEIDWMQRFYKRPIKSFLQSTWFTRHYQFLTLQPFPSLTIARKLS